MSNISVECCMSTISIHASCQLPISTCMSNTGNRRTCNQSCLMFMLLDIPYSFVCVMCVSYVPNDHEKHWMEAGNNVSNVRLAKLYLVVSSANAASSIGLYLSIVVNNVAWHAKKSRKRIVSSHQWLYLGQRKDYLRQNR